MSSRLESRPADLLADVRERVSTRAKRIRIEIAGDAKVTLVLPGAASRDEAWKFLQQRREWVLRKQAEILQRAVPSQALRWDGSDQLLYRGELRSLRHAAATVRAASARFGDTIELFAPAAWAKKPARLEQALRRELREEARYHAEQLIGEAVAEIGRKPTALRIADQKTVWGSCAADGTISLNWRLLMAPPQVFRYVVIHELCHLVYRNHRPPFWSLVGQYMPEYPEHVEWLNQHTAQLHAVLPRHS